MRPRLSMMAAVVAAGLPAAARAYDKPPSVPTVDATIIYQVTPQNRAPQRVRVYFGQRGDLLRVDGPNGEGDTVLDRRDGQLTVVLNGSHSFMVIPSNGPVTDPFLLDPANDYQRVGTTQSIAGRPCDDWTVTSAKGRASVCVDTDGLLLSASGADGSGASGRILASSVSTAALPPTTFEPPAGYQRVAHPASQP